MVFGQGERRGVPTGEQLDRVKDLTENPAVKAAAELVESAQQKLARDLHDTPVGKLSRDLEEVKTALKAANLLK